MNRKEKKFYDSYDTIFSKPTLFKTRGQDILANHKKNSAKFQLPKQPQKIAAKKKSPATPSRKSSKKERPTSKKKSFLLIILVLAVVFFVIKITNSYSSLSFDDSNDYVDILPLEEASINGTGVKDIGTSLLLTINDHTILTNRGYELRVLGDSDIKLGEQELSVLPTNAEYVSYLNVGHVSFYLKRSYERSASISMSGNVVTALSESFAKEQDSFSKAYLEKEMDDVKNGYVVTYDTEGYPQTTLYRFYLFPDETGIWIELDSIEEEQKKLSKENTLEEMKEILSKDFTFINQNFIFKKTE